MVFELIDATAGSRGRILRCPQPAAQFVARLLEVSQFLSEPTRPRAFLLVGRIGLLDRGFGPFQPPAHFGFQTPPRFGVLVQLEFDLFEFSSPPSQPVFSLFAVTSERRRFLLGGLQAAAQFVALLLWIGQLLSEPTRPSAFLLSRRVGLVGCGLVPF